MQLWTALAEDEEKEVGAGRGHSPALTSASSRACLPTLCCLLARSQVIYAMIDLDANKQTAARFRGVQVPAAVLLRDRAVGGQMGRGAPSAPFYVNRFVSCKSESPPYLARPLEGW